MSDKDSTPLEKPITDIEEEPKKKRTKRVTPLVQEALKKATEGKKQAAKERLAQKKIDAARLLLEHDRKTRPTVKEEAPKIIKHKRAHKIVLVEESSGESDSEDVSSDDSSEDEPIIIQRQSRNMVSQQRQSTVAPRKPSKQVKPPVTHQSVPVVKDWSAYFV